MESFVKIRIDSEIKEQAAQVLEASGLTTSIAIRIFLQRVVEENGLPSDFLRPNAKTRKAIAEGRSGKTTKVQNPKDLIKTLNADN